MLNGVVEGFYGRPYTARQRSILIKYLSILDEAAYVYAPKNDPFHRLRWREDYPQEQWTRLSETIDAADNSGLRFIFAVSPWQFHPGDSRFLRKKVQRALDTGAAGIALHFDDIPEEADASLAFRQLQLVEEALDGFDCTIYLCPSIYCTELLDRYDGGEYLAAWRENIRPDMHTFWTGDSVISKELDENSLIRAGKLLGGKPIIWDNLLADDYTLRRIFLAGLEGRMPEGYSYFFNPSSCFLAALHSVYMLLKASDVSCDWFPELGDMPRAWEIISEFHHLPWHTDKKTEALLRELKIAAFEGPSKQLITKLRYMSGILNKFIDSLEEIKYGFEMMPYVVDVKKIISWWQDALALPSRSGRISRLRYLMFERLPFDHPLSITTAELSINNRNGEQ